MSPEHGLWGGYWHGVRGLPPSHLPPPLSLVDLNLQGQQCSCQSVVSGWVGKLGIALGHCLRGAGTSREFRGPCLPVYCFPSSCTFPSSFTNILVMVQEQVWGKGILGNALVGNVVSTAGQRSLHFSAAENYCFLLTPHVCLWQCACHISAVSSTCCICTIARCQSLSNQSPTRKVQREAERVVGRREAAQGGVLASHASGARALGYVHPSHLLWQAAVHSILLRALCMLLLALKTMQLPLHACWSPAASSRGSYMASGSGGSSWRAGRYCVMCCTQLPDSQPEV